MEGLGIGFLRRALSIHWRMGWVWRDDEPESQTRGEISRLENPNPRSDGDQCSTRKVVRSQCRTEEVEPGKFVRKCEKTEELLRDCVGRYF